MINFLISVAIGTAFGALGMAWFSVGPPDSAAVLDADHDGVSVP